MTWLLAVASETEEGEAVNPLIPHLAEIIVGLIAFGLLFFFLSRAVFPRFERAFRERTEAIEGGLERAERTQREAEALAAQYRQQMQEARADAARIRTEAQSERASIVEAARVEAQQEAERVAERSRAQLQADLAQVRAELSREVGQVAVDLAGRVLGENLADTDRTRRTVDRFLDDLEGGGVRATVGSGPASPDGAAR